jgi:hypothetical protein
MGRAFQGILTNTSGYFKSALSGRWETNNSGSLEISDNPDTFEHFLNYAYTGLTDDMSDLDLEYCIKENSGQWPVKLWYTQNESTATTSDASDKLSFLDLLQLYEFADRRDVKGLSDVVVSTVLEKVCSKGELPVFVLQHLLESTAAGSKSPMFSMLVDVAARCISADDMNNYMEQVPKEFLTGVIQSQRDLQAVAKEQNRKLDAQVAPQSSMSHENSMAELRTRRNLWMAQQTAMQSRMQAMQQGTPTVHGQAQPPTTTSTVRPPWSVASHPVQRQTPITPQAFPTSFIAASPVAQNAYRNYYTHTRRSSVHSPSPQVAAAKVVVLRGCKWHIH